MGVAMAVTAAVNWPGDLRKIAVDPLEIPDGERVRGKEDLRLYASTDRYSRTSTFSLVTVGARDT